MKTRDHSKSLGLVNSAENQGIFGLAAPFDCVHPVDVAGKE